MARKKAKKTSGRSTAKSTSKASKKKVTKKPTSEKVKKVKKKKKQVKTATKVSRKKKAAAVGSILTHQMIADRAYRIYQASGCIPGRDQFNWAEAERQLRRELNLD